VDDWPVQQAKRSASPDVLTLGAFVGAVLIAGNNFVAVKFSNRELEPLFGAGLRFVLAAAILFLLISVRRIHLPRGKALTGALLYGFLFFFGAFGLMYMALVRLPAGVAGLVGAAIPLITFLFAYLHGLEKFRWRGLIGAAITIAGIAVLVKPPVGAAIPVLPMLAMIGAASAISEAGIVIKKFPPSDPMATNAIAMSVGAVSLLAASAIARERWKLPAKPSTIWAVSYLVILGSVFVFALYLYVLKNWTATAASYEFVVIPLVTVIAAALLTHERITLTIVLGGLIVLAGVYVGALSHPRKEPATVAARQQEAFAQRCS
jgi:drug/metabolite transporter (DMT)-like permease